MTPERMKEAFDICGRCVHQHACDLFPKELSEYMKKQTPQASTRYSDFARHLLFMCEKGKEFVDEGRAEKACRWLGFIQGFLCAHGFATIDEMKTWNMPKEEHPDVLVKIVDITEPSRMLMCKHGTHHGKWCAVCKRIIGEEEE